MANRTEFNLNDNVASWKKAILTDANFTNENITELESHLLDEIHDLEESGLTCEESFIIAKRRIGEIKNLASEYGKVNKKEYFINKTLPYLKGVLFFLAFTKSLTLLATGISTISHEFGVDITYLNAVSIGSLLLGSLGVLIYILKVYERGNRSSVKLIEIPVLVGVIVIAHALTFLTRKTLMSSIGIEYFGQLQMNIHVYSIIILLGILALSYTFFIAKKKQKKMMLGK